MVRMSHDRPKRTHFEPRSNPDQIPVEPRPNPDRTHAVHPFQPRPGASPAYHPASTFLFAPNSSLSAHSRLKTNHLNPILSLWNELGTDFRCLQPRSLARAGAARIAIEDQVIWDRRVFLRRRLRTPRGPQDRRQRSPPGDRGGRADWWSRRRRRRASRVRGGRQGFRASRVAP